MSHCKVSPESRWLNRNRLGISDFRRFLKSIIEWRNNIIYLCFLEQRSDA